MHEYSYPEPDVFFLPLAADEPERIRGGDPWVMARRIPDFLHLLINQGEPGPTAMLEVQTPPDSGEPVEWVQFAEPPEAAAAFEMLPPGSRVRAVVTGRISMDHEGLRVEILVHNRDDHGASISATIQVTAQVDNPTPALCKLARHLARFLGLDYADPPADLLTDNGSAFFHFLAGLDGSALLSGDLEIECWEDPAVLMQPYQDALSAAPDFGLALRTADYSVFRAVDDARLGTAAGCEIIDGFLSVLPVDGEGCVYIADHLASLGDDVRARAWLEHASHLSPPPPKSLENLGILCANSGEVIEARNLWLDGLDLDGHPDFLAHLARLSFTEGQIEDAWDKSLRGLRRIYERCARIGEWGEEGRDLGLLLRYLVDHMEDHPVPQDVIEALLDLCGLLAIPEDQIDLGKCLMRLGYPDESRAEIQRGLDQDLDPLYRDDAVRMLLLLDVPDFDERFARASDEMATGGDPTQAIAEMESFLAVQPEFWPAIFLKAMGLKRRGEREAALDCLAEVLSMCPDQPDSLFEMAELFAARGNPKRSLECIDDAIASRPQSGDLHFARARYLEGLGRGDAARAALEVALSLSPDDAGMRELEDRLRNADDAD